MHTYADSLPSTALGLPARSSAGLPTRKTSSKPANALPGAGALPGALPGSTPTKPSAAPTSIQERKEESLPAAKPVASNENGALPGALPGSAPKPALSRFERFQPKSVSANENGALPASKVEALPAPKTVTTPAPVSMPGLPVLPSARSEAEVSVEEASVEEAQVAPIEAPKVETQAPKAKAPRATKSNTTKSKKKNPGFRMNDGRDRKILHLFAKHEILLPYHLGYEFRSEGQTLEQAVHSITQRLRQMMKDGLLLRDDENYPAVWRISNKGLNAIDKPADAPTVFPAVSRRSHLLKIATITILFGKEHDPELNVRYVYDSETKDWKQILTDAPKLVVTEKQFTDAAKVFDPAAVKQTWANDVAEFIDTPGFPATPAGNRISDIEAYYASCSPEQLEDIKQKTGEWELTQRSKMIAAWKHGREGDGYFHLINHQGKNWGKAHRPDAWICLPNIVDENGVVRGGDFAIEVEHSRKSDLKEQSRILMQLWDHPKADGCIYYVKKGSPARRMIERAIKDIKNRKWEPKAPGKKPIDEYFILMEQPYLNKHLHAGGLWG